MNTLNKTGVLQKQIKFFQIIVVNATTYYYTISLTPMVQSLQHVHGLHVCQIQVMLSDSLHPDLVPKAWIPFFGQQCPMPAHP